MNTGDCLTRTALLIKRDVFPSLDEVEIVEGLTSVKVQITADAETVNSPLGQTALASVFTAITELGAEIRLFLPRTPIHEQQPPYRAPTLAGALVDASRDLITPAEEGWHGKPDLTVVLGRPMSGALLYRGDPRWLICLEGDEWSCSLQPGQMTGKPWSGTWPFGGLLAGVLAGAEAFRAAVCRLESIFGVEPLEEHPLGAPRSASLGLPPLPLKHGLDLGAVDVISGGAIVNGALFSLLRVPDLRADLRLIEDDAVSLDNLNRCGLFLRSNVEQAKARALARWGTDSFTIEPVIARFEPETADELLPLAERVLVGVDAIPSRWFVQANASGWLGVGATSHFGAMVSEHLPNMPCAGCLHPYDEPDDGPLPTISFVSLVAGVVLAYRLLRTAITGEAREPSWIWPLALAERYGVIDLGLAPSPRCPVGCAASTTVRQAA
jgi:hypothetical protein